MLWIFGGKLFGFLGILRVRGKRYVSRMIDGIISWVGSLLFKESGWCDFGGIFSFISRVLFKFCYVVNIFINNLDGNIESMFVRFKCIIKMNVTDSELWYEKSMGVDSVV